MAKFKLSAGAELDLLTSDELRDTLRGFMRDWQVEAARGPKAVRFSASGVVAADGSLQIGGSDQSLTTGRLGPDPSMIWEVKRWAVSGLSNGDSLTAYVNASNPNSLIKGAVTSYDKFGTRELVLPGGDILMFVGAALLTPAGTNVFISGGAWELPATLAYRLD